MSTLTALAMLAVGTFALRAVGVALAARETRPAVIDRASRLIAPAVIAALLVIQTLVTDARIVADERLIAVGIAALLAWRRAPFVLSVAAAVATAALLRAL